MTTDFGLQVIAQIISA